MNIRKPTFTLISFILLSVAYIVLVLLLPPNTWTIRNYNLSTVEYRVLAMLLAVPRVVVWLAAYYGYAKLQYYAKSIQNSRDGQAFAKIAVGLRWLAWGLPIGGIVTQVAGGIAHNSPSLLTGGIWVNHAVNLIIALIAFTIIGNGTHHLLKTTKKPLPIGTLRLMIVGFIVITIAYSYGMIQAAQRAGGGAFHMPVWLILLTTVAPYLYAWSMGLLAAYEFGVYRRQIIGILYQKAISRLSVGLALAIAGSVVLQFIVSTSDYLRRIQLDWSLLLVYIALIVYAAGFTLIAYGSAKLQKIEEV